MKKPPSYEQVRDALLCLTDAINRNAEWDDGCLYIFGHSASDVQTPLNQAVNILKETRPQ